MIDEYLKELETVSDEDKIKIRTKVGGAVIIKKGENDETLVLLIRRAADDHFPLHYEFPRGGCDYGNRDSGKDEPLIPCIKREAKEESGLDIIPIKFIDKFSYLADKGTRLSTQYNYLCRMKNPNQEVKLSKEHDDYKWVQTVGEIELHCLPEIKKTISKILNTDTQIVTYHDNELEDGDVIPESIAYATFDSLKSWANDKGL